MPLRKRYRFYSYGDASLLWPRHDDRFRLHPAQDGWRVPALAPSIPGRGDIRTPAFMPVGTVGTVKGLYLDQVKEAGADIILGNTYHLMLRPGAEQVADLGGLAQVHRLGWPDPDR